MKPAKATLQLRLLLLVFFGAHFGLVSLDFWFIKTKASSNKFWFAVIFLHG